jgi:hypothetical protein
MRAARERIAAILFSGAAWAMALVAGPHLAHALRHPARLMAHAAIGRRRDLG